MAVAIIGLPGRSDAAGGHEAAEGLRPPPRRRHEAGRDQRLRDPRPGAGAVLARPGPEQKIEVALDLIARVPGEYRGPASRAYLYYNADHKHWSSRWQ